MADLISKVEELKRIALNPKASIIEEMKRTGKKAVGCFPVYTPDEVIYAAGLLPVGMWGGKRKGSMVDRYLQSFSCSIMRANMEQAIAGDYDFLSGVVVTGFCDTLKCVIENFKLISKCKVIPIVYPQNRKLDCGKEYFITELEKLKREVEELSGKTVTEDMLEEAVDIYDEYRLTMQEFVNLVPDYADIFDAVTRHLVIKAGFFMDKAEYTAKIKEIICDLKNIPVQKTSKKRIVLSGVLGEPIELLEILDKNDLFVVADDIAQESRQFRTVAPKTGTAFDRMAERVSLQDGCAFLYDSEKKRGKMILDMVESKKADAVVFLQLKFCDPEEFDYPIIKRELEEAGVKLLYLESEQIMDSMGQIQTRIQSFCEMLE